MFCHFKLLSSWAGGGFHIHPQLHEQTLSVSVSPSLPSRGDVDVSAVCQYQIADVKKVFEGSYKEYREAAQRWGRYTGAVPMPRPGAVRPGGGGVLGVGGDTHRCNDPCPEKRELMEG